MMVGSLPLHSLSVRTFKRREVMPLQAGILWQIQLGVVRTLTFAEDGIVIPLGFWSVNDAIGQPLACIQPYQIECLTAVEASPLKLGECWDLNGALMSHIHQMQELLRIRHGQIQHRLLQFLNWLTYKFGRSIEHGKLIQLRLTHQDIADVLGTTRVTVTRLMQQLEQAGIISQVEHHQILLHR